MKHKKPFEQKTADLALREKAFFEPCLEPGHVGRLIVALVTKQAFSFMRRPHVGSESFLTTGL